MDGLESWLEFRRNETAPCPQLKCCECGGRAQGNVSCEDGQICDGCHEKHTAA